MVFAPTVLDRVRQAVQAKVAAAKPIQQKLFAMVRKGLSGSFTLIVCVCCAAPPLPGTAPPLPTFCCPGARR